MAKLPRVTYKRFGANANLSDVGQFGSAVAGAKLDTKDVATIQSLPAWSNGWASATMSDNKYPTRQERNGVDYVHAYQIDYMLRSGVPEYDSQTEYDTTSIVKNIEDDKVVLYHSIINNNIGQSLDNIAAWEKIEFGSSRNIGEIIPSAIPLTDAGLHLLDGSLISGSGSYSEFVTYIAGLYNSGDYTAIFDTEASWQATVSQYGVCGKFVYDSVNNTVRLPKYSNKIYTGGGTAPVIGNGKGLGLTNGSISGSMVGTQSANCGLVLSNLVNLGENINSTTTITSASIQNGVTGVTTDVNNSGLIAQLSNITTSLEGYYYIVVATTTKTDIEVDIDEIATDLNGKADVDLANTVPAQSFINSSMLWTRIDFANGISLTINSDYTCPSDGCLYVRSVHVEGAAIPKLTINGTTFDTAIASGGYVDTSTFFVSVSKNDVVKLSAGYTNQQLTFFPLKGVA